MRSDTGAGDDHLRIITVGSSSKKAGKSSLASHLVRELKADYGMKVSSGGSHAGGDLIDDPAIVGKPGTDTGALVKAGAKRVIWLNAPPSRLAAELEKALGTFAPCGLLVVEGNSVLEHLTPDFAAFVMSVPFQEFKPSAYLALQRADLVLVNRTGTLRDVKPDQLKQEISKRSPDAKVLAYDDDVSLQKALQETVKMAKRSLRR
jgi:molybdopterin-guanine dinucleotide biosynthesis protein